MYIATYSPCLLQTTSCGGSFIKYSGLKSGMEQNLVACHQIKTRSPGDFEIIGFILPAAASWQIKTTPIVYSNIEMDIAEFDAIATSYDDEARYGDRPSEVSQRYELHAWTPF